MLKGYDKHIFSKQRYQPEYTEQKIIAHVRTPSGRKSTNMFYRMVVDNIVRNYIGDNLLYIDEVKTASSWSAKEDHYLAMDEQVTSYIWGCRQVGIDVEGVMFTICLKPTTRPNLTKEAKSKKSDLKKKGIEYTYTIEDYETPKEYLSRIEKMYLSDPTFFLRKKCRRTPEQIKRFERELYYKCLHAKQLSRMPVFANTSMWDCPSCDGYEYCVNGRTEESIAEWYERHYQKKWDEEDEEEIVLKDF